MEKISEKSKKYHCNVSLILHVNNKNLQLWNWVNLLKYCPELWVQGVNIQANRLWGSFKDLPLCIYTCWSDFLCLSPPPTHWPLPWPQLPHPLTPLTHLLHLFHHKYLLPLHLRQSSRLLLPPASHPWSAALENCQKGLAALWWCHPQLWWSGMSEAVGCNLRVVQIWWLEVASFHKRDLESIDCDRISSKCVLNMV